MKVVMKQLLLGTLAAALFAVTSHAASNAEDNAGNYNSGNWVDSGTPNFGTGWGGAWTLSAGGIRFTDSTFNGSGSGGINSGNSAAWGLQASTNGGFTASAIRPFSADLSIGQTFSLDFDNGFVAGGGVVGLSLQSAGGDNRFEFYFKGGSPNYFYNNGSEVSSGIGFTANGLHLSFTLTGASTLDLQVIQNNSTNNFGGLALNTGGSGGIGRIRFFDFQGGAQSDFLNDDYTTFYNNIAIVPEPSTMVLVGCGLMGAWFLRRRKA